MSRRQITWAATSVPEVRRQWTRALDQLVERFTEQGLTPPEHTTDTAGVRKLARMQSKLAAEMQIMTAETDALRQADLYWVSRDMVDVALDAATSLPEWSPSMCWPSHNGLLCWAKPAGVVPYGPKPTATTDVPWDAVWWWLRPDGLLQLTPASRFTKHPELIAPYEVSTPLWSAHTIVVRPNEPRREEVNGTEDAHPFVSVVGAAWLLMGQPSVTQTRTIADSASPRPAGPGRPDPTTTAPAVTLVDVHRPVRAPHDKSEPSTAERQYNRRWWVGGHWRQQPCGPEHSQRRPTWIAPYVKGPQDKPLSTERVNVWRR
ncbi:hypothetical protein Mycsm_07140 (plasmid) [Mycobacterium sp. JS623]|uniref:hypothetical protein n=1 Tax=Mycobacterium sp. JS623 TaxID=212767 RepID=UPI0002A565AA|nr:hypothetical protein [Mycobacterium sp. JS623]AGB27236.1 hypothetical protein Mycsm_07140 [Mycobacterium sp. JS623]